MGRHSVTLRPSLCPHLKLEAFEERALLSASFGLSAFLPNQTLIQPITHTLDAQSSVLVSSDLTLALSSVETKQVPAEQITVENGSATEEMLLAEQATVENGFATEEILQADDGGQLLDRNETVPNDFGSTEQWSGSLDEPSAEGLADSVSPATTDGELWNLADSNREGTGDLAATEGADATSDSTGTFTTDSLGGGNDLPGSLEAERNELRKRIVSSLLENQEPPESRDNFLNGLQESSRPDPVVVRGLQHYVSEPGSGNEQPATEQGTLPTPTGSDSARLGEVRDNLPESQAPADGRAELRHQEALQHREALAQETGPYRLPPDSRPAETRPAATLDREVALVSQNDQAGSVIRKEGPATEVRPQDSSAPNFSLLRQATDTRGPARGQEAVDVRPTATLLAAVTEQMTLAGLQRGDPTGRAAQNSASQPLTLANTTVTTATTQNAGQETAEPQLPVAVVPTGILDLAVFVPHMSGLLDGIVPFDREAVQVAVQQLLIQVDELGGEAASWLAQMNLSPWVVAVAVGLTACDVVRRRQQQAQRGLVLTDADGTPLTWFPGLAGLWNMQDA